MNKIPNITPMKSAHKNPGNHKLLKDEQTPFHLRDIMTVARDCGKQLAEHEWNNFVTFLSKEFKNKEWAGNDMMSVMSTFAAYFVSTWTIIMKRMIADKDDTAITQDEIINSFFEGVHLIVKTAKVG